MSDELKLCTPKRRFRLLNSFRVRESVTLSGFLSIFLAAGGDGLQICLKREGKNWDQN